jgi:hypothetical protein
MKDTRKYNTKLDFFFSSVLFGVEMSMIQAYRYEKSCYTDDKSDSCERKVVEELIGYKLIGSLYIEHTSEIERHFYKSYDPKYRSMNSVDQYQEEDIHQWKVEHTQIVEKYRQNSRKISLLIFYLELQLSYFGLFPKYICLPQY